MVGGGGCLAYKPFLCTLRGELVKNFGRVFTIAWEKSENCVHIFSGGDGPRCFTMLNRIKLFPFHSTSLFVMYNKCHNLSRPNFKAINVFQKVAENATYFGCKRE